MSLATNHPETIPRMRRLRAQLDRLSKSVEEVNEFYTLLEVAFGITEEPESEQEEAARNLPVATDSLVQFLLDVNKTMGEIQLTTIQISEIANYKLLKECHFPQPLSPSTSGK